jgi:ABC-2 type transport system ATP-binding protein
VVEPLRVQGLVKRYGCTPAVDRVDLVARAGEVTALLGPNGAGKTTTIECCEGLRRPDAGQVRVLGQDPWRASPALRARVGVVLQDGGLPTGARPLDVLRHVARLHACPRDVGELVQRLGLGDLRARTVRRLSGGQRQRLALACALVGRPDVLFLDEPSSGLDPQARHAVWDLVRAERERGTAVVLTTHDMDEAERLADAVVVVDGGRVVTTGSPAALTGAEQGAATIRFSAPPSLRLDDLRRALPPSLAVSEPRPGDYLVEGNVDARVLAGVTAWCAARDVMPQQLSVGRRSLEDVFLDLTGRSLR